MKRIPPSKDGDSDDEGRRNYEKLLEDSEREKRRMRERYAPYQRPLSATSAAERWRQQRRATAHGMFTFDDDSELAKRMRCVDITGMTKEEARNHPRSPIAREGETPEETHRRAYPGQYEHPWVGKRVKSKKGDKEFVVKNVVLSQFGALFYPVGSTDGTAYAIADFEIVSDEEEEKK